MNKKLYIQPETNSVKIELHSIIAASPNSISSTPAAEGTEDSPVNFSRRGGSLWDDED